MIPFEDLRRVNRPFEEAFHEAFGKVLASGRYVLGEQVAAFEREFAGSTGARFAIGVSSGSDAITLSLRALGAEGGEVVVPGNGCPATALAVIRSGCTPVFAEPDPRTLLLDPAGLERRITPRTVAVLPVHLYGLACDMEAVLDVAGRRGIPVVEDCSQAHGASFKGRRVGTFGKAGAFSFYPTKALGALGDGGAVVTDDADLAERVRILRNYGYGERDLARFPGTSSRLDEVQAAFLRVKLRGLEGIVRRKNALAERYERELDPRFARPAAVRGAGCAWQHFVVLHPDRDCLRRYLGEHGIGTSIHYPHPPGRHEALAPYCRGDNPRTEEICATVLSLPLSSGHSDGEIDAVIGRMNDFLRRCH